MTIEARALVKSFGGTPAVAGVSFLIEPGSITGLLGLNGAGKTTTMRLLSGTLTPDSGTSWIAGHCVQRERRLALSRLGYLPEAAQGFHDLTPREFLLSVGRLRGLDDLGCRSAIDRIAADLNLTSHLDLTLRTLSKGWRQRAWLAQTLLHAPGALVLDEPTDGLDPGEKLALHRVLRRTAADKAILVSTHILEEADAVCDRIIIMAGGRVRVDAPLAALKAEHGSLAAAFARLASANPSEAPLLA